MSEKNPIISIPENSRSAERGASMVEYALLIVLIALIAFAAVAFAGDELSDTYHDIAGSVQQANDGGFSSGSGS